MKLIDIKLENFRNVEEAVINLEDRNMFVGDNGAGKSSVIYAIQMALFGRCEKTASNGAGSEQLIGPFAKDANIYLSVMVEDPVSTDITDGHVLIHMTITPKGQSNSWSCMDAPTGEILIDGVSGRADWWTDIAGVEERYAAVATMGNNIVEADGFNETLARFLNGSVSVDDILCSVDDQYREAVIWYTEKVIGIEPESLPSSESFWEVGKAAYNDRREKKRAFKEHDDELAALGAVPKQRDKDGNELGADDIPRVEGLIEKTQSEINALERERGRSEASSEIASGMTPKQAKARLEKLAGIIEAEEAKLNAAKEHASKLSDAMREAMQEKSEIAHRVREQESIIKTAERGIEQIDEMSGDEAVCPTCGAKLTEARIKKLRTPWNEQIETAREKLTALSMEAEAADGAHDSIKAEQNENNAQCEPRNYKELQDAFGEQRRIQESMKGSSSRSVDSIDVDLHKARQKLQRGKDMLEALKRQDFIERKSKFVADLRKDIEFLDYAVAAFHKGEVIVPLIEKALGDFTEQINPVVAAVMGNEYEVEAEPEGKAVNLYLVKLDAARTRVESRVLFRQASDGERAVLRFAIAISFGHVGSPVAVDNVNELDNNRRVKVIGYLKAHKPTSTILFTSANQKNSAPGSDVAAALRPVALYWVEAGRYERKEVANG